MKAVARQIPIPIVYDGIQFEAGFRADLVVADDLVIVELKAVEMPHMMFTAKQLLTQLRLSKKRLGLLINFSSASPISKRAFARIVNGLPNEQREPPDLFKPFSSSLASLATFARGPYPHPTIMTRLPITKTPKVYVGGAFIRSESGRVLPVYDPRDASKLLGNVPRCTRKDLRNAVEAAAVRRTGMGQTHRV